MNISIFIEFSFWSNEHYNYCCLLQFIKLYSTLKCVMEIFTEFHFVNITYIYFYWIHFLANWIYNYSKLFYCLWQLINFYFLLWFTIKSLWMYWNFIYEYIHWTLLFWSISHIIIPNYFVDFRKIWLLIYLLDCYEYIWIYTMNFISFNVVGNSCHFIVTDKIIYRLLLVYAICTVW